MKGVDTLRRHGIRPGVICVLTRESLAHPQELFNFFLEHGFGSLGFNVEEIEKVHTRSSLDTATVSNEYRHFMEQLFDLWWPRRADMVIREFDDFGQIFASCASDASWSRPVLDTEPFGIITVQRDGDISTFSPELAGAISAEFGSFVIGNVKDIDALADLQQTAHYQRIEREARESVAMCRSSCGFFPICGGEFLSNKFSEHGTLRSTVTMTCRLHRQVLATTLLDKLSSVSVERNESNVPPG
jgi:uncharacterized protein